MTDAYLLVRANFIYGSLYGNASFPTPMPSLDNLHGIIVQFTTAVQAAEGGSRQEVAAKNALRQTLIDTLHLLGNFVLFTAGGNEVVATSSGFRISREAQPKPSLTNPDGLVLKAGLNRGELELSCRRVKGAMSYVYQISETPLTNTTPWKASAGTASKVLFDGLESGKEYACRIAAIGPRQQTVYSDVMTRIAV